MRGPFSGFALLKNFAESARPPRRSLGVPLSAVASPARRHCQEWNRSEYLTVCALLLLPSSVLDILEVDRRNRLAGPKHEHRKPGDGIGMRRRHEIVYL